MTQAALAVDAVSRAADSSPTMPGAVPGSPSAAAPGAIDKVPSSRDAADFMAAYNRHVGALPTSGSSFADSATRLLGPLVDLSGGSHALSQAAGTVTGSAFKPSDVMELTLRAHEFMFRCELTATVANRGSDGVQTLFKQQS